MTEKKLKNLLKKFRVPPHIIAHMEKVALVAGWIAKKLIGRGYKVDPVLLRHACLLHDLVKVCEIQKFDGPMIESATAEDIAEWEKLITLYSKKGHIKAAFDILTEAGETELAGIILKHRFEALIDEAPAARPSTWEEKLLYYADKRVMHDKIVTLKARLKDGRRRYFRDRNIPENSAIVEKGVYDLEKGICNAAGIMPLQINEKSLAAGCRQSV